MSEGYKLFCIDYPDIKLGRKSLYSCKPDHVMLRSKTPADSCLCIYHENMRPLVTLPNCFPALKDFISSKFVTQKEESVYYKLAFHVEI